MGDVDLKVFIRVGFASIAIQGERFPLGWKWGVGDKVSEGVTALRLVGGSKWGGMGWLIIVGKVEVRLCGGIWVVGRYCGLYDGICVVCRVVGML